MQQQHDDEYVGDHIYPFNRAQMINYDNDPEFLKMDLLEINAAHSRDRVSQLEAL